MNKVHGIDSRITLRRELDNIERQKEISDEMARLDRTLNQIKMIVRVLNQAPTLLEITELESEAVKTLLRRAESKSTELKSEKKGLDEELGNLKTRSKDKRKRKKRRRRR